MGDKIDRPGYQLWIRGGTRGEMADANRKAGYPCYCDQLWSGICDMCTGLAPEGGERYTGMLHEQQATKQ